MFRLNFGLKPVFGFKPWFQTLVLTKDKVTHCQSIGQVELCKYINVFVPSPLSIAPICKSIPSLSHATANFSAVLSVPTAAVCFRVTLAPLLTLGSDVIVAMLIHLMVLFRRREM